MAFQIVKVKSKDAVGYPVGQHKGVIMICQFWSFQSRRISSLHALVAAASSNNGRRVLLRRVRASHRLAQKHHCDTQNVRGQVMWLECREFLRMVVSGNEPAKWRLMVSSDGHVDGWQPCAVCEAGQIMVRSFAENLRQFDVAYST